MNPNLQLILFSIIFTILLILQQIRSCFSQNDRQYETCWRQFQCGGIGEIGYPFWGGDRPAWCGYPGFELSCLGNVPRLNISSLSYRVLSFNFSTRTLRVSRDDLWSNFCPTPISQTTLNFTLFDFYSSADDQNITLHYGCTRNTVPPAPPLTQPQRFDCPVNGSPFYVTLGAPFPGNGEGCRSKIYVPVNGKAARSLIHSTTASLTDLQGALRSGFSIQWWADNEKCGHCMRSGGLCGQNQYSGSFACYCMDRPYRFACPTGDDANQMRTRKGQSHAKKYIIIGVTLGVNGTLLSSLVIFYVIRHRRLHELDKKNNQVVNKFLLTNGSLAPKRYSYSEINKMTESFTNELGQGGYGIVYQGKLPDGQLVAVKVLTETNDNGEEFINEVASISRTSHVNIVNLLGFCYDRKRRALVYEFMPNKSLDKFICKSTQLNPECRLEWEKLYAIAVGVARGLEYLHRGCSTRIVHFDIKPHNILLDEDFCPKISDFGLAKLFKKKQSIVSMLGTRGTIGYIAPEVFSRNFGAVSHKSDVYSYGMLLLEMVGARKIDEIEATKSNEDYFPDKIYDHVVVKNNKVDDLISEEHEETARKILLVGLWCIQTAPSNRPSMTKVLEMLEASLQSIQIPPKPFLSPSKLSAPQFSSMISVDLETINLIED